MSRFLILMYHIVDEPHSPVEARYCVRPAAFRAQMAYLATTSHLLSLIDAVHALKRGDALPANSVVVTFDDGFECFHRNALPVLSDLQIPTTLFAVAGSLGKTNNWMQAKGWPERQLMDTQSLRQIQAKGVTVGCHSLSHKHMTQLNDDELAEETRDARRILSGALDTDVTLFAYPYGDQSKRERRMVAQAGFVAACWTEPGFNGSGVDLYALRRIDVYGNDSLVDFRRKLAFGANRVTRGDLAYYYFNRLISRFHA